MKEISKKTELKKTSKKPTEKIAKESAPTKLTDNTEKKSAPTKPRKNTAKESAPKITHTIDESTNDNVQERSAESLETELLESVVSSNVELFADEEEIYTLFDNEGLSIDFYGIACIEMDENFYLLLHPVNALEGVAEDEAVIFRYVKGDDDSDQFFPVEDEELLNKLFDEYLIAVSNRIDD